MKIKWHVLIQSLCALIQGINVASITGYFSFLPAKYAPIAPLAIILVGAAQAVVGWYNHYFTPSGLPAGQ